jgi:hypothetical protein
VLDLHVKGLALMDKGYFKFSIPAYLHEDEQVSA